MNLRRIHRLSIKFLFYAVSAIYCLPFFLKICMGLYDNFYSSSVSFNLDTLYLNWNTTFPAVTVCEIYNGEKVWDISEEYFGAGTEHNLHLDDFVGEIVFFRGTCTTCEKCDREMQCPLNFTQLAEVFRSKCAQLIINCRYTNNYFNCCEEFKPIQTEYGLCYAFNSNQARKMSHVQYANNRNTGAGYLKFDISADIQLHVHPPIDIPFLFSEGLIRETVLLGSVKEIVVNVMEVHNHVSVQRLPLEKRRCRFGHERTQWGRQLGLYDYYSFSTCVVECTLALHLQYCNCSSHVLANGIKASAHLPVCDFRGLSCLNAHYFDVQEERKSCDCMSSCDEPEYTIVFSSANDDTEHDADTTHIRVALVELPSQRFVRRVTKDFLDLLISVGGIAGLFFNTSLLRIVEFLFLICRLNWTNLRVRL